jgi:hypothetical protein
MRALPLCAIVLVAAAIMATATPPASARNVPPRPIDAGPDCDVYWTDGHGRLRISKKCTGYSFHSLWPKIAPHLAPSPLPSSLSSGFAGKHAVRG